MDKAIRIGIAGDHPTSLLLGRFRNFMFRDGLRRLLERETGMKILGDAADGAEAVKLARRLKPDILLLDLAMLGHPGFETLRELSMPANSIPVRVIVLTALAEKRQIIEALQLGARGIVLKGSPSKVLFQAIPTVMSGEYWVGHERISSLVQYLQTLTQDETRKTTSALTPRELQIVATVVAGFSNKEIADYFRISEDTVKHHLTNIFDKLGTSTRLELALSRNSTGIAIAIALIAEFAMPHAAWWAKWIKFHGMIWEVPGLLLVFAATYFLGKSILGPRRAWLPASEKQLQKAILKLLKTYGIRAGTPKAGGAWIRTHMLVAFLSIASSRAILWIDCKERKGDKQLEDQAKFQKYVEAKGYRYLSARSPDDVLAWLKEHAVL